MLISDSKPSLKLLQHGLALEKDTQSALHIQKELHSVGFNVMFQLIPSHMGIARNEAADRLARNAFDLSKAVKRASSFVVVC